MSDLLEDITRLICKSRGMFWKNSTIYMNMLLNGQVWGVVYSVCSIPMLVKLLLLWTGGCDLG